MSTRGIRISIAIALCMHVTVARADPRLTPADVLQAADNAARQQADLKAYTRGEPSYDHVSKTWGVNYRLSSSAADSAGRGILSVDVSDTTGFASVRFWLATPTPVVSRTTAPVHDTLTLLLLFLTLALTLSIVSFVRNHKLKDTAKMPRSIRHWEITREAGRTKFILINGILGWGLSMFIIMTFVVEPQHTPLTAKRVIVSACIWPVSGALFGWLAWASSERKYKKFREEVQPNKA